MRNEKVDKMRNEECEMKNVKWGMRKEKNDDYDEKNRALRWEKLGIEMKKRSLRWEKGIGSLEKG